MSRRTKHRKRYQEIINTFIRNGLSHFLFRIGLTDNIPKSEKSTGTDKDNLTDVGIKLRNALQDLGPTFIKLGQIASSRRDLVPKEIAVELEKLQDDVKATPFNEIKRIIEEELDDSLENIFIDFDKEPLATASIGQVHIAQLPSGDEVAVKVQRPDIEPIIETDLAILHNLSRIVESRFSWAKQYNLTGMIDEFSYSLRNELNYELEARNGELIAEYCKENDAIHIPKIYWKQTTQKVLTMELIKGIKVSHYDELIENNYDTKLIAERITDAMLQQILVDGFFHGDPHSGNIYILPDNRVAFLDFGMVGRLDEDLQYHFSSLVISLQAGDTEGMLKTFDKWELTDDVPNRTVLRRDLDMLIFNYYDVPLEKISLGKIIAEIFTIARKHRVKIPSDIAILAKVILTLESIIEQLHPELSIMDAIEPYGEKLLLKRYDPRTIARKSWERFIENIEYISEMPKDMNDIAKAIKAGKIRLDLTITDLQDVLRRFDKISNRLSFSIILLSFSILMVGLIIGAAITEQTTLLWRLPVIEIGTIVATLMFLFMIFIIIKSGRM